MDVTVNKGWTTEQKRRLQKMLNDYGFTDVNGNALAVDGNVGPKTMQALEKMNRYQDHLSKPDSRTRAWQAQLRDWGFKEASGTPLKVDGVHGPKTDAVTNGFENSFFDGFTEGKNQKKTVQTKTFPTMQKMNDAQILKNIGVTDPEATQKDANGNWIQVAKPETWSGSTITHPENGQLSEDGTWKQVAKPGTWSGYTAPETDSNDTTGNKIQKVSDSSYIRANTNQHNYGSVYGNVKKINPGELIHYSNNYLDLDYIKEKNRGEAFVQLSALNSFTNNQLDPLLNAIKDAQTVNYKVKSKDIKIQDKRNHVKDEKVSEMNTQKFLTDGLDVLSQLGENYPPLKIPGAFAGVASSIIGHVSNAQNVDLNAYGEQKYPGYDKQGDTINDIKQENITVNFTNDSVFGQKNTGSCNIELEYHIVNGEKRILLLKINNTEIYNNY